MKLTFAYHGIKVRVEAEIPVKGVKATRIIGLSPYLNTEKEAWIACSTNVSQFRQRKEEERCKIEADIEVYDKIKAELEHLHPQE